MKWLCPHCGLGQVLTHETYDKDGVNLSTRHSRYGPTRLFIDAISCVNKDCGELTLTANIKPVSIGPQGKDSYGSSIDTWKLRPRSFAKPQPDFIPQAIRDDYYEACSIASLSPKASATLARRCIQGMIRDFCGITDRRLIDEIKTLSQQIKDGNAASGVNADVVDAIDSVRQIGNIGAHMEKDINVIIDVDPKEAEILINLIEMLFAEWYVARNIRLQRIQAVMSVAENKKSEKS